MQLEGMQQSLLERIEKKQRESEEHILHRLWPVESALICIQSKLDTEFQKNSDKSEKLSAGIEDVRCHMDSAMSQMQSHLVRNRSGTSEGFETVRKEYSVFKRVFDDRLDSTFRKVVSTTSQAAPVPVVHSNLKDVAFMEQVQHTITVNTNVIISEISRIQQAMHIDFADILGEH